MFTPADLFRDIPGYARWIVGIDFGFGHPFAAVLIAWTHDIGQIWVIDSFRMERSSALYHTQRIHSMTRGLRIPVAWPHDGQASDKGSGLPLAGQYKSFGTNLLAGHAVNDGTKTNAVEPALEEMRELMFGGKLTIAGHNHERLLHLLLLRGDGLATWIGLMVVVQNIFTSLLNSHIFDFHQGWMYVLGVGVAGGLLKQHERRCCFSAESVGEQKGHPDQHTPEAA
jgi:hypothetical protein